MPKFTSRKDEPKPEDWVRQMARFLDRRRKRQVADSETCNQQLQD